MPRHCSVGGCKSRDNRETRNAGITFHKLPKRATRRSLWITNSHRADSWDPQTNFVYFCSKHFTPESFELTGYSGIRRLKEDAFPTLFDSSSTTKCKRVRAQKKQEKVPVSFHSIDFYRGGMMYCCRPSQKRRPCSGAEHLQQLESSSLPSECRPSSPSRYMRRLPPPPGFYLSKEHSYAQLCPLLWRRRYDQAIDCLEKALRQLHAARRRENRLRSTVLRLRENQLKSTLLVSRDSCKNQGTGGGYKARGKGSSNQEESETDAKSEDAVLFEDRHVDQVELGDLFPDSSSWCEEDRRYCFYCGSGQTQVGGQVTHAFLKTGKYFQPIKQEDKLKIQRSIVSTYSTDEDGRDIHIVKLESPPGNNVETSSSEVLFHSPCLQHMIPAGLCLSDTQEQSLQFYASEQKLLVSDRCKEEHHAGAQEQFWIQSSVEGQIILLPVPAEDGLKSFLKMEEVTDEVQTILTPEVDDKGDMGCIMENSRGVARAKTAYNERSVITGTSVERREDVREKLKEHLEGFHLQLSTEFIN